MKPTPCTCGAYKFPHRLGGGKCAEDEPTDKETVAQWNKEENDYLNRQNARDINRRYT